MPPILHAPTDEEVFEDLVEAVLRIREGNQHLVRWGRRGQFQGGIDGHDPLHGRGLVWQSTIQAKGLQQKLTTDVGSMDADGRNPRLFIFACSSRRDAGLQEAARIMTSERRELGRCPIEPLFWDDLEPVVRRRPELLQRFFPAIANTVRQSLTPAPTPAKPTPPPRKKPRQPKSDLVGRVQGGDVVAALVLLVKLAKLGGSIKPEHLAELERAAEVAKSTGGVPRKWTSQFSVGAPRTGLKYPDGATGVNGADFNYPGLRSALRADVWKYPNGQRAGGVASDWRSPSGRRLGTSQDALNALLLTQRKLDPARIRSMFDARGPRDRALLLTQLLWRHLR